MLGTGASTAGGVTTTSGGSFTESGDADWWSKAGVGSIFCFGFEALGDDSTWLGTEALTEGVIEFIEEAESSFTVSVTTAGLETILDGFKASSAMEDDKPWSESIGQVKY